MQLDRWQTKATWREGEARVSGTAPWELKPSGTEMGQETWTLTAILFKTTKGTQRAKVSRGRSELCKFSTSQDETQTSKKHVIQKATTFFWFSGPVLGCRLPDWAG